MPDNHFYFTKYKYMHEYKNNYPTGFLKTVLFTVLELFTFIFLFPFGFLMVFYHFLADNIQPF